MPSLAVSFRAARLLVVLAVAPGCGVPERFALPVAIPLTQGGTAVPAHGGGGAIEFGDGLLGQELMRTEILSLGLLGGVADRFSFSFNSFTETRGNEMEGAFLRAKGRIGSVLGPESSVAVALAFSTSSRQVEPVQDERVTTVDFAVPAEFLLASSATRRQDVGGYVAPRVVFERYVDRLDESETLSAAHWGALAGVHARAGNVHLFGELNLLHVSGRTVRGETFEGGLMLIPAIGLAIHLGQAHRWGRPLK